ncbi:HET-domain-containing protein [Colletotrichum asianum]
MFQPAPEHLQDESMPWVNDSMIWVADRLSILYSSGLLKEAEASHTVQDPNDEERTLTYPINDILGSMRRQIEHHPTSAPPRDTNPPPGVKPVDETAQICERCARLSLDPLPNPVDMPPQGAGTSSLMKVRSSNSKNPVVPTQENGDDEGRDAKSNNGAESDEKTLSEYNNAGSKDANTGAESKEDEKGARVQWYFWMEGATDTANAVDIRAAMINEVPDEGSTPCHRNTIQRKVADLGQFPDDFATASCPLCNVFTAVRTRLEVSTHGHSDSPFELNVVSATYVNFETTGETEHGNNIGPLLAARRLKDTAILAIDPKPPHVYYPEQEGVSLRQHSGSSGYLYPVIPVNTRNRRFSGRRIATDTIDYDIVKGWLNACRTYHPTGCGNPNKRSARDIPGFRVMNVSTEEIVCLPEGQEYVALSYVWGTKAPEAGFPRVVQDAFVVCRNLGVGYLWVDRYCIDQSGNAQQDPEKRKETQNQLANMHIIYEAAVFAIIACAGEDANFGLPGWTKRGWTYQEGLLSTRRLIFTEYQVYFECNFSHCTEAVFAPDDIFFKYGTAFRYGKDGPTWPPIYGEAAQSVRNFPMAMSLNKGPTVFGLIEEYMTRSLTFTSDNLNGMLGILSRGSTTTPPFGHFWGLPIFTTLSVSSEAIFDDKVHQTATLGLLQAMDWSFKHPAKRNPMFPSWSWAGWEGPLELSFDRPQNAKMNAGELVFQRNHEAVPSLSSTFSNVKIEVEVNNEAGCWQQQHFDEFYAHHGSKSTSIIPETRQCLYLEGLAMTIKMSHGHIVSSKDPAVATIRDMDFEDEGQFYFEVFSDENEAIFGFFKPTLEEEKGVLLDAEWDALIFKDDGGGTSLKVEELDKQIEIGFGDLNEQGTDNLLLMLLRGVDGEGRQDAYERLGTARIAIPKVRETSKAHLKVKRKSFRMH